MVSCAACGAKVFISGDLPPLSTTPCTKCGNPVMMPMRLRQFELRDAIASGGMGTVYRAFDLMLERDVAVKLMRKELAEDTKSLENFYCEARACAALNHTNIIHIYTFDEIDGQLYLALTGHVPFEAPTVEEVVAAHIHTLLTPPNQVLPEITQPTNDGLMIAMAKTPADRYRTYDDFRMALEASRSQLLIGQLRAKKETGTVGRSWWRR